MKTKTSILFYALIMGLLVLSSSCKKDDDNEPEKIVKDVDGNVYKTVKIGTQTWMAENLKTTLFADGDKIPDGTEAGDISTKTSPFWFAYNNDLKNVPTYGRLYTWYTVTDTRKICPAGWHLPTDKDWTQLIEFLNGDDLAGGKLKEKGELHWKTPNEGATNESGFTALGSGYRDIAGSFIGIYEHGFFWSADDYDSGSGRTNAHYCVLKFDNKRAFLGGNSKKFGFPVRCVKN